MDEYDLNSLKQNSNIKILVEKIRVEGNGVILLTGPSGCGKGEIAKALSKFLSIPEEMHLSMGEILRKTISRAKNEIEFKDNLAQKYKISTCVRILDEKQNNADLIAKALSYGNELTSFFQKPLESISQFEWLEYCVTNGLLVPDQWTEKIIEALFENSPDLKKGIIILDGYPRTVTAARFLVTLLDNLKIPVIKVLHLFITKEQMSYRALNRKRPDDTLESLERRYQFYIDKVQPCIDYLKSKLGNEMVSLIDAHQPFFDPDGTLNVSASIHQVVISVIQAMGLPGYLFDLDIA